MTSSNPTLNVTRFIEQAEQWQQAGVIRTIDLHWIKTLSARAGETNTSVFLAGMLVSQALGQGHVCLFLRDVFTKPFADLVQYDVVETGRVRWTQESWHTFLASIGIESFEQMLAALNASSLVNALPYVDSEPNATNKTPMVLINERLYLHRYFDFEQSVVAFIRQAQKQDLYEFDKRWLDALFPKSMVESAQKTTPMDQIDWQKIAVANSALQSFSIISGGPGTGKTTTVTKLLALLIMQANAQHKKLKIELAAPTGKAAARLTESIIKAKQRLIENNASSDFSMAQQSENNTLSQTTIDQIPEQASTLHRLLGSRFGRSEFAHNNANPLHLDVLLVDEASMVDLPMMAKLLDALPDSSRLILLGDKDQLASVEAGSALADLTDGIATVSFSQTWLAQLAALSDVSPEFLHMDMQGNNGAYQQKEESQAKKMRQHLSLLTKSYRFEGNSGIGKLSAAVNVGDSSRAITLLENTTTDFLGTDKGENSIAWQPLDKEPTTPGKMQIDVSTLAKGYDDYWRQVKACSEGNGSIESLFRVFSQYQVLTAVRNGEFGVEQLNDALQNDFYERGHIRDLASWYIGKAVMVTRNDASLGVFNGDIGICMPDPASGNRLRVWFELSNGTLRGYLPSRLNDNEAVFVMTVHKSQGSEFDHIELILPPYDSSILTKELFYTGITRAKKRFRLWANLLTVRTVLTTNVKRYSGLIDALW